MFIFHICRRSITSQNHKRVEELLLKTPCFWARHDNFHSVVGFPATETHLNLGDTCSTWYTENTIERAEPVMDDTRTIPKHSDHCRENSPDDSDWKVNWKVILYSVCGLPSKVGLCILDHSLICWKQATHPLKQEHPFQETEEWSISRTASIFRVLK